MTVALHIVYLASIRPNISLIPQKLLKNHRKMVTAEDLITSLENSGSSSKKQPEIHVNGPKNENLFSPGFRSVAAMAGWDEEALLVASLIVDDTPDRLSKHKKRSCFRSVKSPPSNSRRKRKVRRSPTSIPVTVLDLDEDETKSKQENEKIHKETDINGEVEKNRDDYPKSKQGNEKRNPETNTIQEVDKNRVDNEVNNTKGNDSSSSSPTIPCIDRLREELSCAVCLEICFEPSTTPCGHSFCKKCLRSAADRCGKKCPKCRQLISNGKYCTVNTVLWNTIQLLFPQEVDARKTADSASESPKPQAGIPSRTRGHSTRNRVVEALNSPESESNSAERRRRRRNHIRSRSFQPPRILSTVEDVGQDEDAALALRLQREEYMEVYRAPNERRNSIAMARANLRAMASRAINIRIRGRRD